MLPRPSRQEDLRSEGLPADGLVTAPVGELAFCVVAGVALDEFHCTVYRCDRTVTRSVRSPAFSGHKTRLIIKPVEYFLITDSLEGCQVAILRKSTHLFDQSLIHHLDDAAVDPVVKHVTGARQTDFLYFEITALGLAGLKRRERLPVIRHTSRARTTLCPLAMSMVA